MWHGHNGADSVDGFGGPLIVRPCGTPVVPLKYDGERTLMLTDWWHTGKQPAHASARTRWSGSQEAPNPGAASHLSGWRQSTL